MAKRLRHKYLNGEIFHHFFHNNKLEYAKGSSSSWRNNICYSYSSEIGYADFEKKLFYFRYGTYSSSTSKHQNHLRHSIPNDWVVIYITNWMNWSRSFVSEGKLIPDLKMELDSELILLSNNRYDLYHGIKYFGDQYLPYTKIKQWEDLLKLTGQYDQYFKWFKEEASKHIWEEEDLKALKIKEWALENNFTGSFQKKERYFNDPILKEKAESSEYKSQIIHLRNVKKQIRQLSKENKELERQKELLIKWKVGKYYGNLYNIPIHLRIDNGEVRTSMGAKVPLKDAERLFKLFLTVSKNGQGYTSDSKSIKIGQYTLDKIYLDEIDNQWKILIGCHLLCEKQIKEFIQENDLQWN